jgi:ABC-type Na+ efflux pump permease subunit
MLVKSRLDIFEKGVVILTLLGVIGLGFYFYDLIFSGPTEVDPFNAYNTNPGIIKISIASLISRVSFIVLFLVLLRERYRDNVPLKLIYLLSALVIGFLQWYELYYGSTFYYGEVRDKQGLMFPLLASLMVTLVIWKLNYSKTDSRNLMIKVILTSVINGGLYLFWRQVYELWNLWQS